MNIAYKVLPTLSKGIITDPGTIIDYVLAEYFTADITQSIIKHDEVKSMQHAFGKHPHDIDAVASDAKADLIRMLRLYFNNLLEVDVFLIQDKEIDTHYTLNIIVTVGNDLFKLINKRELIYKDSKLVKFSIINDAGSLKNTVEGEFINV